MSEVFRCSKCGDEILTLSNAEISDEEWDILEEWEISEEDPSIEMSCEHAICNDQFICQSCLDDDD